MCCIKVSGKLKGVRVLLLHSFGNFFFLLRNSERIWRRSMEGLISARKCWKKFIMQSSEYDPHGTGNYSPFGFYVAILVNTQNTKTNSLGSVYRKYIATLPHCSNFDYFVNFFFFYHSQHISWLREGEIDPVSHRKLLCKLLCKLLNKCKDI